MSDLVLFIDELAQILGTSVRTIQKQLRAGTFPIPELPRIDRKHRWSRERVHAELPALTQASRLALVRGARKRA